MLIDIRGSPQALINCGSISTAAVCVRQSLGPLFEGSSLVGSPFVGRLFVSGVFVGSFFDDGIQLFLKQDGACSNDDLLVCIHCYSDLDPHEPDFITSSRAEPRYTPRSRRMWLPRSNVSSTAEAQDSLSSSNNLNTCSIPGIAVLSSDRSVYTRLFELVSQITSEP